jgi:ATP-dependent DNA helicase RecQ
LSDSTGPKPKRRAPVRRNQAAADAPAPDATPAAAEAVEASASAEESPRPAPKKRSTRRKAAPEPEPTPGEPTLAADELPADALPERASPIDEEMLEAIRREVTADRQGEDELYALAQTITHEEDEVVEDEIVAHSGPLFVGPVPLDTPEERLAAMAKAAQRLGIAQLHPEQERVIDMLLRGEDVLMVLPTGFGKSACYQIPSLILTKPVLVLSPLLALMKDQFEKMRRLGVPCVKLDGTVRGKERENALAEIARGERLLVMTTPETLGSPDAQAALTKGGISMAAVDEAHCISEWGYDFRPAYLKIGERLKALGGPPALALTATATEKVRLAIVRFVGMRDPQVVATSPHRSNLAFDVLHCSSGARLRALVRLALRVRRPGIIYCSTTRDVDELYTVLQRFGVPSHRYHGKMSSSERAKNQEGFMSRGRRTVMVATSAFGLGIDKPDIRYVMHYQAPSSLEQYVQEAGRAGRDGRRSNCIMLYSPEDRAIHEALLSRSRVRPEQLFRLASALLAWAKEDKVPSVDALSLSGELGSRTTTALLSLLEEAELVKWDPTAIYVVVPLEEFEPRARLLAGQFETLRTQDARRLDAVADYATGPSCRAWFLREYFGEEDGEACGMCDRCRGQADRPDSFWEPLAPPRGDERRRGRGRNKRGRHQQHGQRRPQHGGQPRQGVQSHDGQQFAGRRNKRRRRRGRNRERFGNGAFPNAPQPGAEGGAPFEGEPRFQGGEAQIAGQSYERISLDDVASEMHDSGAPPQSERPEGGATWQAGPNNNGQGGFRRRRRGRRRGGRGRRWREREGGGAPQGDGGFEGGGGGGDRPPSRPPESSGPSGE